jgi:hypothetical protein
MSIVPFLKRIELPDTASPRNKMPILLDILQGETYEMSTYVVRNFSRSNHGPWHRNEITEIM